jgi:hypothetical protein
MVLADLRLAGASISKPPTPKILANIAQELSGKAPPKNWSTRFVARHKDQLDARHLN